MTRHRITITVKKDLLNKIDKKIDGSKIRNRSHAIEYLLNKSMGSKINKAFILAGGKGMRMRPYTYEIPKCMITIKDKPILEYIIELLGKNGINEIYIGVDYLSYKIKRYFSDGKKFGVKIKYISSKKPLGTGGALKLTKKYLKDSKFLMLHGDILTDIDLIDMVDFSLNEQSVVTMALTSVDDPSLYGSVKLRGTKVVEFLEKPELNYSVSRLVNAGVYFVKPEIFNLLPQKRNFSIENDVLGKLIKNQKLSGYHFAGKWFDISTPKNYTRAIKSFKILDKKL